MHLLLANLPFARSLVRTFIFYNIILTETAQKLSFRLFYALENQPPPINLFILHTLTPFR